MHELRELVDGKGDVRTSQRRSIHVLDELGIDDRARLVCRGLH
jgi:hypothetical protein